MSMRPGLKAKVYRVLLDEIEKCVIKPGAILMEGTLAVRFGVSKTPVREALLALCGDGLVDALPRTGFLVRPVDLREAIEVYDLRILLESEAAARAAARRTEGHVVELKRLLDRTDSETPSFNRAFHVLVATIAGSETLRSVVETLLSKTYRASMFDPHLQAATQDGLRAHKVIVTAIEARDSDRARAAMAEHVANAKARVIDAVSGTVGQ